MVIARSTTHKLADSGLLFDASPAGKRSRIQSRATGLLTTSILFLQRCCAKLARHEPYKTFQRRGVVEGFFGPLWSMAHRRRLFEFGAARRMNTYLYAPKDDSYHRKLWRRPIPRRSGASCCGWSKRRKEVESTSSTVFTPASFCTPPKASDIQRNANINYS